jgi:hypothetical protein
VRTAGKEPTTEPVAIIDDTLGFPSLEHPSLPQHPFLQRLGRVEGGEKHMTSVADDRVNHVAQRDPAVMGRVFGVKASHGWKCGP